MLSAQPPNDTIRAETPPVIYPAALADAGIIAQISVDAFPQLFRSLYGRRSTERIVAAQTALYAAGVLDLARYRVAALSGAVVGVCAHNTTGEIGAATFRTILRTVRPHLSFPAALRAAIGVSTTLAVVPRRIPCAPDILYIEALAVTSHLRSHGIGTSLLRHAAATAVTAGRPRLSLHVMRDNNRAYALYRRFGFIDWKDPPQAQWMTHDSRLMVLNIEPHHMMLPPGSAGR
ncbi:MAG: GNAT family N-acetyltransferase [Armatimonadetes bacterium]|nr:GNAT family N-acetyltransferase [Armatimonadota bacterium]MDE2207130.1 GNAT family N-acetyltransferase [Armatimonadota bacterium]